MNNDKNKNCLLILDSPTPAEIREQIYMPADKSIDSSGFVYVLECGEYVKIGKSKRPDKRYSQIRQGAYCYGGVETGRMAISARAGDYSDMELKLHSIFAKLRKPGTELFSVPFEVAIMELERNGTEEEAIMDEAELCFYCENKIKRNSAFREICDNGIASQIMTALLSYYGNRGFNYISLYGLAYLTGLSIEEVKDGLMFLEDAKAIKTVECGEKVLVKHIF